MIVRLERPRKPDLLWRIYGPGDRLRREVFAGDLPRRILREGLKSRTTYWFATNGDADILMLHDRVPKQDL